MIVLPDNFGKGDFNGDGLIDLAYVAEHYDHVFVVLNNGDGSFQAPRNFATGAGADSVAVADVNGDGKLDLVTANQLSGDVSRGERALLTHGHSGPLRCRLTPRR